MNNYQKLVLIIVAIILIVMLLFPPFHFVFLGAEFNLGYHYILNPPLYDLELPGSIKVDLLFLQLLFVLVVGAVMYFVVGTIRKYPRCKRDNHSSENSADERGNLYEGVWKRQIRSDKKTITLNLNTEITLDWPNKCALCGSPAEGFAEASLTKLTDFRYYLLFFSWKVFNTSISYPVCKKHKLVCNLLDFPARQSFLGNIAVLLFVPCFVILIILMIFEFLYPPGSVLTPTSVKFVVCGPYGVMIFFYLLSAFIKPVKLCESCFTNVRLKFRRKKFLKEFVEINKGLIDMRVE